MNKLRDTLMKNGPIYLLSALALCLAALNSGCASNATTRADARDSGFDVGADRPAPPRTLCTMARILSNQQRDAEAEELLHAAIQQSTGYAPAYSALAEIQARQNRLDEALDTLRKGLAVAPREAVLHNNMGMCFVAKADY